ncbi:MAG: DUF6370 family protein [Gemmataceae bacterium]
MRAIFAILALVGACFLVGGGTAGEKDKEVVLKGTITCAKCDLGKTDACATVIVVKKDKKDIVYYFDPAGHKKYHGPICTDAKAGTVTGVLSKDGDKMIVTVKKVDFK